MATHSAVVTVAPRAPLQIHQVDTPSPGPGEVLVRNLYTASTPLDLHQADGHLLVTPPQILGDGTAGIVVQTGPGVARLKRDDKVFGYTFQTAAQKSHQEYVCAPEHLLAKLPPTYLEGDRKGEPITMQSAVTLPNNFVSAWHTITSDLGLALPWPKSPGYSPVDNDTGTDISQKTILIWGGSSSVGQFALQILRWYGYKNLIATASPRNFDLVKACGASSVFDYRAPEDTVVSQIRTQSGEQGVDYILDCIGSQSGSLRPLTKFARKGTRVAVLLPVIISVKSSSSSSAPPPPEYSLDASGSASWADGTVVRGVRTHFYQNDAFLKENLQAVIMPRLLAEGIVKPNRVKVVEGETLLERAQKAVDLLREGKVSGERLVWRVSDS